MNPLKNPLKSKRAALWLTGMFLLIGGFLVVAVTLPHNTELAGSTGPDVQVPRMANVPSPNAPKMEIDVAPEAEQ